MDILIIFLFIYEITLGICTHNVTNCIDYVMHQYIFTLYYFIFRLSLNETRTLRLFFVFITIIIACVSLICIVSFELFKSRVLAAGFESLCDFKYLYRPFGELNNLWSSISFSLLGLLLLGLFIFMKQSKLKWYVYLPILPLLYCLIGSFSRGVYIALAMTLAVIIYFITISKIKLLGRVLSITVIVGTLICISLPNINDVKRTIRMTETESQRRSISGRITHFSYLLSTLIANPLIGNGTNNYSLAVNELCYENDNHSFTNFAPNIISQILLEKGIIGFILWLSVFFVLFGLLIYNKIKRNNSNLQIFIFIFITIILLKEMTFPTLLIDVRMLMIMSIFLSVYINSWQYIMTKTYSIPYVPSIIAIGLTCSAIMYYYYSLEQNRKYYISIQEDIENGRMGAAEQKLCKMGENNLASMYKAVLNWRHYKQHEDKAFLRESNKYLTYVINKNNRDVQFQNYQAIVQYYLDERATAICKLENLVSRFPYNASYHLNLANMYYQEGKWESAAFNYSEAIMLIPSILESETWHQFAQQNDYLVKYVTQFIKNTISTKPTNPILLAKYGKIWYLWGNYAYAKKFLLEAITLLPNLEMPWYYLLEIAKRERNKKDIDTYQAKVKLWKYNDTVISDYKKTEASQNNSIKRLMPYCQSSHWMKCSIWYRASITPDFFDFYLYMP